MAIPISAQPPPAESVRDFAAEVRRDLALSPRQLQSKYLYDGLGSALFEAICHLPWYRITRAEGRLLSRFAAEMVAPVGDPVTLTELGCGSGEKLAMIAEALRLRRRPVAVHLIDISPSALELSERTLGRFEHVSVVGHRATYEEGLRHAARDRSAAGAMLVLFLGSNIGNFDPPAAREFLAEIRRALRPGDWLLLGADLVKPERELLLAYDDPLGRDRRLQQEPARAHEHASCSPTSTSTRFDHRAVWNAGERRVEMHLVSRRAQTVRDPARRSARSPSPRASSSGPRAPTSTTPTRSSRSSARPGFGCHAQWIEPEARFALTLFTASIGARRRVVHGRVTRMSAPPQ